MTKREGVCTIGGRAIALAMLGATCYLASNTQAQSTRPPASADPRGTPSSPLVGQVAPAAEADRQVAQERENEHARKEALIADGTVALAIVTFLLFAGTAILATYTYKLWKSTAQMAEDTKASGDATLKHLETTARHELRAYISLKRFVVTAVQPPYSGKITHWEIAPRFHNAGLTPAHNLRIYVNFEMFPDGLPADGLTFLDYPVDTPPSYAPLGPKMRITGSAVPMDLDTAIQVVMQQSRAFIWGRIEYDDIFGPPRRVTEFAAEVMVIGDALAPEMQEVRLRALNRHNEAT